MKRLQTRTFKKGTIGYYLDRLDDSTRDKAFFNSSIPEMRYKGLYGINIGAVGNHKANESLMHALNAAFWWTRSPERIGYWKEYAHSLLTGIDGAIENIIEYFAKNPTELDYTYVFCGVTYFAANRGEFIKIAAHPKLGPPLIKVFHV